MKKMHFSEHLEEMRVRCLKSLFFIIIISIITYSYSDMIIDFLIKPAEHEKINFQVLKITSIFLIKISISIVVGIILSFPFLIYQILKFLLPAFKNKLTNQKIIGIVLISFLLFAIGLSFGYKILIPISTTFFMNLSMNLSFLNLNYTLENYLVYLIWILIISSFIFQLPLLIISLVKIGVLNVTSLSNARKHIIIFIFILAAVLTPPDPISQLLVVMPLYILFEVSLLISRFLK